MTFAARVYIGTVVLAAVVLLSVPADFADAVMVMLVGWLGGLVFAKAFL